MKKTRFLLILLCFCMLLPLLVACGKDTDQTEIPKDKYDYDDSSRERAADSIPYGYNLEGQSIIFWHSGYGWEAYGLEDTTDIVYSRIHERNLSVAERLNVNIEFLESTEARWQDAASELQREVRTMSTAFDAVLAANNILIQMKLFNYFHNLNDSNYIDIDERWWYTDAIMEISVDDYNYRFLYGDFHITNLGQAGCIFYNKQLYEQYVSPNKNPDDLYDTVLEGKWTLDEFARIVKKSHITRGGDGTNDIYGLAMTYAEWNHYLREAAGIRMYERNDHGIPEFNFKDDRSIDFTNKLYSLYYENEGCVNTLYNGVENKSSFTNGTLMFDMNRLLATLTPGMREMKDDFGILPYPKLNEDQEEYVTLLHNATVAACVPISTDEDKANEEISAVIEALASESYRNVAVAYYETALKTAYNRDDQSAQMIDIITAQHDTINSTLTKNFAYEYNSSLGGIGNIFNSLMTAGNTNFVSQYDGIIGSAETGLKALIAQYKDGKI